MSLTEHFRRLSTTRAPDEAFLAAFGKAVRNGLHRSEMWEQPPAYLGYPEFRNWHEAFADGDAFAPPALDCYLDFIVPRLGTLMDHLQRKDNIDGLIYLNIDRFFLARQRQQDAIGYSVFKNLQAALEELAAAGQICIENRIGGKLRNPSRIRLCDGPLSTLGQIEAALGGSTRWEQVLPRQVKIGKGAQRLLKECLQSLRAAGVAAFRLGDLAGPLKARVRDAHARRNRVSDSEVVARTRADESIRELIRIAPPSAGYDKSGEDLDSLVRRMRAAIEAANVQERTRAGMRRLFDEFCRHADTDEEIPAGAELARQLGVPAATLWDHLRRLRELALRPRDAP